jgi:hypothetical protein
MRAFLEPDYSPRQEFYDTRFVNVEDDALVYIPNPAKGWANIKDCGNFPCTGIAN